MSTGNLTCRVNSGIWYRDRAVWHFVLTRYLPIFAVLNLLWEVVQLPLYTLWSEASPTYIAYAVLHCTAGDVLIGAGTLLTALVATRASVLREWNWIHIGFVAVMLGLVYTAFSEWMNTSIRESWAYSERMPVVPIVPIGLSPLLQWLLLPIAALVLSRWLAVANPSRWAVVGQ